MQVMELLIEMRRLGWDSEVVVSIDGLEHRVLEFKEGVLGDYRAILVVDPEPIAPRRKKRNP